MTEFIPVAPTSAIPAGQAAAFAVNGRMVAIFNEGGAFYAIDDFCPHMGAALSTGHFQDGSVTCPWHAWRFCVRDGTWCDNPKLKVDSFEVRVENDQILVRVPPRQPRHTPDGAK